MPRCFYHIKDQTRWPETIVLVQVFGPGRLGAEPVGRIRSIFGIHPDGNMSVSYALDEAEVVRMVNQLESVGVYLDDGADWNPEWGELVDLEGLGLP